MPFELVLVLTCLTAALAFWALWYWWQAGARPLSSSEPTPKERLIQVRDADLYVEDTGAGQAVLLLHGIGASTFTWRFVAPILALKCRVIALDLAGFGRSTKDSQLLYGLDQQADRVFDLIEKLDLKECILVGSSMGGALALWMGKLRPDVIKMVVALAPATDPRLLPFPAVRLLPFATWGRYGLNSRTIGVLYRRVVHNPLLAETETIQQYLSPYLGDNQATHTFLKATELLRDPRLPAGLAGIRVPVLLLHGNRDRLVSLKRVKKLQSLLAGSELLVHPDAGHHSMEDQPDWIADQVIQFIARHSTRG